MKRFWLVSLILSLVFFCSLVLKAAEIPLQVIDDVTGEILVSTNISRDEDFSRIKTLTRRAKRKSLSDSQDDLSSLSCWIALSLASDGKILDKLWWAKNRRVLGEAFFLKASFDFVDKETYEERDNQNIAEEELLENQIAEACAILVEAAKSGNQAKLKVAIEAGADVAFTNQMNELALDEVAKKNHLACAKILLKAKAFPDQAIGDHRTSLHTAASYGHTSLVGLLLDYKATIDAQTGCQGRRTALHEAAYWGHPQTAIALLQRKADPSITDVTERTPLECAQRQIEKILSKELPLSLMDKKDIPALQGCVQLFESLHLPVFPKSILVTIVDKETNKELLANVSLARKYSFDRLKHKIIYAKKKQLKDLKNSVQESAELDVNFSFESGEPFDCAVWYQEKMNFSNPLKLEASFVSVEEEKKFEIEKNDEEFDAIELAKINDRLIQASAKGNYEEVLKLIAAGADVHSKNSANETALNQAAENDQVFCAILLLEAGADVNTGHDYSFPLLSAASHGSLVTLKLLISRGADVNLKIQRQGGETALFKAAEFAHFECVKHLLEHGADHLCRSSKGFTPLEVVRAKLTKLEKGEAVLHLKIDDVVNLKKIAKLLEELS